MNVLFISQDGLTDALGQSQVLPYVLGLNSGAIKYSVISLEKAIADQSPEEVKAVLRNAGVTWTALTYSTGLSLLSSFINYRRMKKAIARVLADGKVDVIHCRSYVSQSAAWSLARKNNIPVIFDMRGFWADERVEGGIWNIYNPVMLLLYKYFRDKETIWIENSQAIISLTRKAVEHITSQFGEKAGRKCSVIPCCADENFFNPTLYSPEEIKAFRKKLGINDGEKILGYAGSTGTWYMVEEMLKQFISLEKSSLVTRMLFITGGNKKEILEAARKCGMSEERIIVYKAKRSEMPLCYFQFDLGIFYIKPTFSKIASSPTKLGEMLLMDIPVICNSGVGDLKELFEKEKIGICHEVNEEEIDFDSVLASLPKKGDGIIRGIGLQHFSLAKGIAEYKKVLTMLGSKS